MPHHNSNELHSKLHKKKKKNTLNICPFLFKSSQLSWLESSECETMSIEGVEERKALWKWPPVDWGDESRKWGSKACEPRVTAGMMQRSLICMSLLVFVVRVWNEARADDPALDYCSIYKSESPKMSNWTKRKYLSPSFSLFHWEHYLSCWSLINGGSVCTSFIGVALVVSLRQPFLQLHHSAL